MRVRRRLHDKARRRRLRKTPHWETATSVRPDDRTISAETSLCKLGHGVGVTSYFGHAALQFLGTGGLFRQQELDRLDNAGQPTILAGFTCHVGRFDIPGFPPLSSALVLEREKGAVAAWASGSLSQNHQASLLAEGFFEIHGDADLTLGEQLLHAYRRFVERGGDPELIYLYNLLGDPLLRMPQSP